MREFKHALGSLAVSHRKASSTASGWVVATGRWFGCDPRNQSRRKHACHTHARTARVRVLKRSLNCGDACGTTRAVHDRGRWVNVAAKGTPRSPRSQGAASVRVPPWPRDARQWPDPRTRSTRRSRPCPDTCVPPHTTLLSSATHPHDTSRVRPECERADAKTEAGSSSGRRATGIWYGTGTHPPGPLGGRSGFGLDTITD
jgi:hypothetical protein